MVTKTIDLERDFPEVCDLTREKLDFRMTSGRYSSTFFYQLVAGHLNIFRKGDRGFHRLDPDAVLDEIDFLEGRTLHTNTKGPIGFRNPLLSDLLHKHHSSAFDMPHNFLNEFMRTGRHEIESYLKTKIGTVVDEEIIKKITHMAVMEGYERRAMRRREDVNGGLTGEWVVFKVVQGINHYLFLGYHDMKDSEIRDWADSAMSDIQRSSP